MDPQFCVYVSCACGIPYAVPACEGRFGNSPHGGRVLAGQPLPSVHRVRYAHASSGAVSSSLLDWQCASLNRIVNADMRGVERYGVPSLLQMIYWNTSRHRNMLAAPPALIPTLLQCSSLSQPSVAAYNVWDNILIFSKITLIHICAYISEQKSIGRITRRR